MAAQDPEEPFDLVDRDGRPLGRSKPRALVHRDGDWHRALHLWVLTRAYGEPMVVLQRRSLAKDTHPGKVDVSVGGHLRAGETADEALREAEEEIGLALRPEDTHALGTVRVETQHPAVIDREILDVRYAWTDRALSVMRPHPDEVAEILCVAPRDAEALWEGTVDSIEARAVDGGNGRGGVVRTIRLQRRDLVGPGDPYRRRALRALAELSEGRAVTPWGLD